MSVVFFFHSAVWTHFFFQTRIRVYRVFYVLFFLVQTKRKDSRKATQGRCHHVPVSLHLVSWHTAPSLHPCAASKSHSHNNQQDLSDMKWGSGSRRAFGHQIRWISALKRFHFNQKNHSAQNCDQFSNSSMEHTLDIYIYIKLNIHYVTKNFPI